MKYERMILPSSEGKKMFEHRLSWFTFTFHVHENDKLHWKEWMKIDDEDGKEEDEGLGLIFFSSSSFRIPILSSESFSEDISLRIRKKLPLYSTTFHYLE